MAPRPPIHGQADPRRSLVECLNGLDRDDITLRRTGGQLPCRQFDHEGCWTEHRVLPPGDAAWVVSQSCQRKTHESTEAPLDGDRSLGIVDGGKMLVKPDREPWVDAGDEECRCGRFRLRQCTRSGVVERATGAQRPPLGREVPIEVDSVSAVSYT